MTLGALERPIYVLVANSNSLNCTKNPLKLGNKISQKVLSYAITTLIAFLLRLKGLKMGSQLLRN